MEHPDAGLGMELAASGPASPESDQGVVPDLEGEDDDESDGELEEEEEDFMTKMQAFTNAEPGCAPLHEVLLNQYKAKTAKSGRERKLMDTIKLNAASVDQDYCSLKSFIADCEMNKRDCEDQKLFLDLAVCISPENQSLDLTTDGPIEVTHFRTKQVNGRTTVAVRAGDVFWATIVVPEDPMDREGLYTLDLTRPMEVALATGYADFCQDVYRPLTEGIPGTEPATDDWRRYNSNLSKLPEQVATKREALVQKMHQKAPRQRKKAMKDLLRLLGEMIAFMRFAAKNQERAT